MAEQDQDALDVDQFLQDHIDTIPHLEALLLLWNSRPKEWSVDEMGKALYLAPEAAQEILDDLVRTRLISAIIGTSESFRYDPAPDKDRLLSAVDSTYRRELIRITRLIHSKPSPAVRAFAQAFRIKKDRE